MGPAHDIEPLVVALADGRSERLLGDDFRQDDMIVRLGQRQSDGIQARLVGGVDVALAGVISLVHLVLLFEDGQLVFHLVGLEVVGQVEFGGGAALHADSGARQFQRRFHAKLLAGHESLAVIIVDGAEVEAELRVAADRPGGVARQKIDFARLKRRKAILGRKRRIFHLGRIAENGSGDGFAVIDVEAGPVAAAVLRGKTEQAGAVDAALNESLGLDVVEFARKSSRSANSKDGRADHRRQKLLLHFSQPFSVVI